MVHALYHTEKLYNRLGNMPVSEIPGLDAAMANRFAATQFSKAYCLLDIFASQFMSDYEKFRTWMFTLFPVNEEQLRDCFQQLWFWCSLFLLYEETDNDNEQS